MKKSFDFKSLALNNGETLSYLEWGSGEKTLLLVHGNLGSSTHWKLLMDTLPEEYKIYAIDMRGFGKSTYNTPAYYIKDYALDLKLFVDALGLTKFNLSGWSLGGAVCMQFVADNPQHVQKLILLASVNTKGFLPYRKGIPQQPPIISNSQITRQLIANDLKTMTSAITNKYRQFIEKVLLFSLFNVNKTSEAQLNEYIDIVFQQRNYIDVNYALAHFNISRDHNGVIPGNSDVNKIKAPTLVIHGTDDLIIYPNVAQEIAREIGNAKLVLFHNCGHFPLIDRLSDVTKEYISFINSN